MVSTPTATLNENRKTITEQKSTMAIESLESLKEAITGLSPNTLFNVLFAVIAIYYILSVLFHHHQQHRPISSEQDRSTASTLSSSHSIHASISQSWNHDVFLSFRGNDTRNNFVDHLYTALVQKGILTYKDNETLPPGEQIGPALLKAIQESRIAIIVFSKNYADSSWCLDELAHVIECMDNRGQTVAPIFYHVDPSDVRKQNGRYGEAVTKHKREKKQKVESWRKALERAGNLSGWVINDTENSHEARCIKEIVGKISAWLPPLITNINKDLIGIKTRLQDLESKLDIGSDGVCIVGIWGVGGGGKTTLASAAYAEFSHLFEAHCFLQNIREESNKHGLEKLQEKIISLILKTKDVMVGSEIEGRSMIGRGLRNKSVLVVLDDVDDLKQLEALAGSHAWFGDGSRIIITTRDEHLLTRHVDTIYEVSLLSHGEAIELFNNHAYRKDKPVEDYEMLSEDVVSYAGGLPLALEVLGSFLYDKDKDEWMSALAKLKHIPDDKVTRRLKISYDGLEPYQQKLFLDIACFWRNREINKAMMVLDACSPCARIGVKVLVQKSLIKNSNGVFDMHNLVEEMALYIVSGAHLNHPEKHSRIWKEKDIAYLCDMGADAPPMETEVLALPSFFSHPGLSDVVANMKKLRWIISYRCPLASFPSNFQPTELGCLQLYECQPKELWHGYKHLPNLKILDLESSKNLMKTPNFDGLPCLERLILSYCSSLEEIHPSIGHHKRLVLVDMGHCSGLEWFPPITQMKKLETLILSHCRQLQQFPDIQSNMDSLVTLRLAFTRIKIIPPSVGQFCTNLVSFDLSGCRQVRRMDGNFHLLKSLEDLHLSFFHLHWSVNWKLPQFSRSLRKLDLSYCSLEEGDIPSEICELLNLQILDLSNNKFSRLHSSILRLPCLKFLNLSECKSLVELPDLPSSIAILKADHCDTLESIGDLLDYIWLWKVSLRRSNKLIGGERVLLSMLGGNAVIDRFMSVISPNVDPSHICMRLVTLQLPHNWYSEFSGILLFLRGTEFNLGTHNIVIKQESSKERSTDQYHSRDWGQPHERVGYVPFSSLSHIPWLNPTSAKSLSFQTDEGYLNVKLVTSNYKIGNLNKCPVDYSECWDDEDRKTFEIRYDSESSDIEIVWRHS